MRRESIQTKWGTDRYRMMEASEIPGMIRDHRDSLKSRGGEWYGDTFAEFEKRAELGDESRVASSEAFLAKIEDQVPMSRGWRNVDDVVGAVPNVPAFLAGHPQCMRRRERRARDNAPLTIYMDLTSSAGIDSDDVERRGVVLLALTRLLVEHRPVELWVGASLGSPRLSGTVAWRIDTAPLDLARAAYHIAATSMSRTFGYGINRAVNLTGGHWPFQDYDLHCRTAAERLRPVFGGTELLYIPPIMLGDEMTRDPVGWLKRTMARYVNTEEK